MVTVKGARRLGVDADVLQRVAQEDVRQSPQTR